jgi:hypothetical protein
MRSLLLGFLLLALVPSSLIQSEKITSEVRKEYLQKSQIWHQTDIPHMDIMAGPQNEISIPPDTVVPCKYIEPKEDSVTGVVPKFKCETSTGHTVRVKYGRETRELYGEIVSSRLFWALGFYADEVYPVQLNCLSCPEKDPFHPDKGELRKDGLLKDAIIEREFPGVIIEESEDQGWKWSELSKIDPKYGGAPISHVDALKLLAVFIQHGDIKADNQRLACYQEDLIDPDGDGVGSCKKPVVMIQDLGSTFGSGVATVHMSKFDFEAWKKERIWNTKKEAEYRKEHNQAVCFGNLTARAPYREDSLSDPQISEQGRRFLAELLNQLTMQQIKDLFRVARVERLQQHNDDKLVTADDWAEVFVKKRDEINSHECAILKAD